LPQWLERCWEQSLVTGGAAGRRILLNAGQFRHVSQGIVRELAENGSPGAGVERLVREARVVAGNWLIGSSDLRAAASGPDTQFFAAWAERFAVICRERDWVDATGLPALLLPEFGTESISIRGKLVLAGFDYPTAAEAQLFDRLVDVNLLAGRIAAPATNTVGGYRIHCDDPADERLVAAQWARTRLKARPDGLIGVVVPDLARSAGAYRRSFLDVFDPVWRERDAALFPVAVADSQRLADTALARTAQLLLRVPEGRLDYREAGQLLLSPYVGGWAIEAAERAQLDLRLRDDRLQHVNLHTLRKKFSSTEDGGPKIFLDILDVLLRQGRQMPRRDDPGNWVEAFEQLLRAAQFCQGRALSQSEGVNFDTWHLALERFASLGEVTGQVGYRQALGLLGETLREQVLRRNERDDGIHIVTPTQAGGMRFDALWLGGMTSAAWPGEPRPSPLIAPGLQRARGIPEAVPGLYRARALNALQALFGAAPECVASCPAHDGEESLVLSPHIAGLPLVTPERLGIDTTAAGYRELHQRDECTTEREDLPPAVGENEAIRGGSRLLNLQSACPARAFFELRLGATELTAPPFALDAATRGKLAHDAAEFFYAGLRAGGGPLSASESTLEQAAAAAISRTLDRHVPPMHPLAETLRATERMRLERLLHALIERDRRRGRVEVVALEDRRQIVVGGITLTVRFDRVDRSEEGRLLVIDYKTGGKFGITKWLGERPLEMQLPLYAAYGQADGIALYWLHARALSIAGMGADDWGINAGATRGRKAFQVMEVDAWQRQLEDWRATCERLIDEFRHGDCRIDVAGDKLATGEYAMLTRRWALGPIDEACT